MSPRRVSPFEPSGCFRESFVQRCDPEIQEAVRLFGCLLEDLALERSLTERGARLDMVIEFRALAGELTEIARQLEIVGREALENPLDQAEIPLANLGLQVGEDLIESALELATAVERAMPPEPPTKPPSRPSRRRSDRPKGHLRPVPDLPADPEG